MPYVIGLGMDVVLNLQIEVNVMAGKGEVELTGQLGDVMKESAMTGISYIRSIADQYKITPDYFKEHDFHIHIPEGAVPKDGPSAGITMATALLSALTHTPVRADLAMTGEINLRGNVMPIGGLKEKLLLFSLFPVLGLFSASVRIRYCQQHSYEETAHNAGKPY